MYGENRGRPRVKPEDKKAAARGAKQGTIDLFKKLCYETGRDPAVELEKGIQRIIDELRKPKERLKILDDEESIIKQKLIDVQKRREKLIMFILFAYTLIIFY